MKNSVGDCNPRTDNESEPDFVKVGPKWPCIRRTSVKQKYIASVYKHVELNRLGFL